MSDKLTVQETSEILGYTVDHTRRLLRAGVIRAEQFNRVWIIEPTEVARVKSQQDAHGRFYHGQTSAIHK